MYRFVVTRRVAAHALVLVIGIGLVAGCTASGPAVTTAPSRAPTASPTQAPAATSRPVDATPTAAATPAAFRTVNLEPPQPGVTVSVSIPNSGWDGSDGAHGIISRNGESAALIGPFTNDLYVYGDPCEWQSTLPTTPATTVEEVVAALVAQASRDASAPRDINVDGHAGQSIVLHVPADIEFVQADGDDGFTACDDGKFASWAGGGEPVEDGPSRFHQGPGQIDELWVLDVNGELIVMDAMYRAATPAEHLDELHAILESMTFSE